MRFERNQPPRTHLMASFMCFAMITATAEISNADTHSGSAPVVDPATRAAQKLIELWGPELTAKASYELQSDRRTHWSNLPANLLDTPRPGLRIGDLSAEHRAAVFAFLKAALSPEGYAIVDGVVYADDVLSHAPRAKRFGWTSDNYWLAFFGEPSTAEPWAWQFGGHHLAVHVTLDQGRQRMSPLFLGVEPAMFERDGQRVKPLGRMPDKGLELARSLGGEGLSEATVRNRPREVYAGPGRDGEVPPVDGSRVVGWTEPQKRLLLDLIGEWTSMLPAASAEDWQSEVAGSLDTFRFAWHGAVDGSTPIYFRIQSPDFLIEFSTESSVGADAESGHYHSVVRNLRDDYGEATLRSRR